MNVKSMIPLTTYEIEVLDSILVQLYWNIPFDRQDWSWYRNHANASINSFEMRQLVDDFENLTCPPTVRRMLDEIKKNRSTACACRCVICRLLNMYKRLRGVV